MMTVEVHIKNGKKAPQIFQLRETSKAIEKKDGSKTLAHFQPEDGNKVIKPFSKLYIDTSKF